jgi:hypothetical protein
MPLYRKFILLSSRMINLIFIFFCRTSNYSVYSVQVTESSPVLKVVGVFTSLLEPYPAEITQLENQFVRIKDSHYFYSPYKTETQKTTIKLASSTIESFSKLSPFSNKGSSLVFGPYKEIQPFQVKLYLQSNVNVDCCVLLDRFRLCRYIT